MVYHVKAGTIEVDGAPIDPYILFKLSVFSVEESNGPVTYVVSRRAAELTFKFNLENQPYFSLFHSNTALDPERIRSLLNHGYFITESKRVYFVSDRIKDYLNCAFTENSLPKLLKLLRRLRNDGLLIDEIPLNLVGKFKERDAWVTHCDRLFAKDLYPYQIEGVAWLTFCAANGIGTILADDMGLGKTAQVIALCCDILETQPNAKILIVVPNPLLVNWQREFSYFAPTLTPFLHYGPRRNGLSSILTTHNIIITPYTLLTSDISMLEEIEFDLVLYDEASMLKNPRSGRAKAARRLSTSAAVAMTGTPVENSLLDVWALCDLVFPGYLGEEQQFKSNYVHSEISKTLDTDLVDLENSIRQITLRRMKKDVLKQLPKRIDIYRALTPNEQERKDYNAIISEIKQDNDNGGQSILALINKLQQFTAHPALLDSNPKQDTKSLALRSAKFEMLLMELDGISQINEKVIIFATFHKIIDLICAAVHELFDFSPGVIDGRTPNDQRQQLIDSFSDSNGFNVLLLHPKTAGMGLNITAATHVIHYCRQWNPALEAQATARAWRNGQNSVVSVYYMFYVNTIEEMIDERIRLKQQLSDQVVTISDYKETDKQLMLEYLEKVKND